MSEKGLFYVVLGRSYDVPTIIIFMETHVLEKIVVRDKEALTRTSTPRSWTRRRQNWNDFLGASVYFISSPLAGNLKRLRKLLAEASELIRSGSCSHKHVANLSTKVARDATTAIYLKLSTAQAWGGGVMGRQAT